MTVVQRRSLWALGLVFGYYAIDRWLPLGAWNGNFGFPVDNPQAGLDIVVLCVVAGLFVAVRREIWPAMIAGTALLGLWCYFHVTTWWWPYLRGVEAGWELTFHDQFRDHVQLLPRAGMHIPPDGEHIAIDVLVVPATVLTLIASIARIRRLGVRPRPR